MLLDRKFKTVVADLTKPGPTGAFCSARIYCKVHSSGCCSRLYVYVVPSAHISAIAEVKAK